MEHQSLPFKTLMTQVNKEIVQRMLEKEGSFYLGLAGGKSPLPLYEEMAKLISPHWKTLKQKLFFVLSDERPYPTNHPESNERAIRRSLIGHLPSPPDESHLLFPKRGKGAFEQQFTMTTPIPPIDLLLLGIGEDGHTASLFPHEAKLFPQGDEAFWVTPTGRFTLTYKTIFEAHEIFFFVPGSHKKAIRHKFLLEPDKKEQNLRLPAFYIMTKHPKVIFFDDEIETNFT